MQRRSRPRPKARRTWLGIAVLAGCLTWLPSASAYTFESTVRPLGPEQTIFDWSSQKCEDLNIPDASVRAFRDASNRVHLTLPHYVNYQMIGPDLNSVAMSCTLAMGSHYDADPSRYQDKEWIGAPYTPTGKNVYALGIDEYQGWAHSGRCSTTQYNPTCWYNAVTLVTSTNGGVTYTHAAPPGQLVGTVPYTYAQNPNPPPSDTTFPTTGQFGYFNPSNIIRRSDGYYYALVDATPYQAQKEGVCVIRTKRLPDPTSWRAWDGRDYTVDFVNPYTNPQPPTQHVCTPVSFGQIQNMTGSLTYNTFFEQYLLVGTAVFRDPVTDAKFNAIAYSTSPDLINWSEKKAVLKIIPPWYYHCGDDKPITTPVVLDPLSDSRNFETTGRSVYLYFTRQNYPNCLQTLDRDLIRIPIQFTPDGTTPPGYVRPKAADQIVTSLVPAYQQCTAPNRSHGPPLAYSSCNPPKQASGQLTVGTPDSNGAASQATASVRLKVIPGNMATPADEADVTVTATATDVRRKSDLQDYPGWLVGSASLRLTDLQNGRWQDDAGTVSDGAFGFGIPCQTTSSTSIGSTCEATTSADAIAPGTVVEGKRAVWRLGQVRLWDSGPDGDPATQDNAPFEVEGVFVP